MIVNSSVEIRVIRALLGMDSRSFAARLGVSAGTLTSWERSRSAPKGAKRQELYKLCEENGIGFLPNSYPMPITDCLLLKMPKAACVRPLVRDGIERG